MENNYSKVGPDTPALAQQSENSSISGPKPISQPSVPQKLNHGSAPNEQQHGNIPAIDAASFATGKGGGALRSIDQSFQVNSSSGTLSLSMALPVTKGRSGFQPSLNLSYDSGAGNGPFGLGWQLSSESITRKTSKRIPFYDDSDVYILSGLEDLVPAVSPEIKSVDKPTEKLRVKPEVEDEVVNGYIVQRYKPRIEQESIRIERWTNQIDTADVYWRTISSANITKIFGRNDESRVFADGPNQKRIFSWLICESYDTSGNAIKFSYKAENEESIENGSPDSLLCETNRTTLIRSRARYLKSIQYGNRKPSRDPKTWNIEPQRNGPKDWMFEVIFDYGEHDVPFPTPAQIKPWKMRKDVVSSYAAGFEIRTYRLCRRMLLFHHFLEKLSRTDDMVSSVSFQYKETPTGSFLESLTQHGHQHNADNVLCTKSLAPCTFKYKQLSNIDSLKLQSIRPTCLQTLPINQPNSVTQWIDLSGEGSPGLLVQIDGSWYYQRNENAVNADYGDLQEEWSDSEPELESDIIDGFGPIKHLPLYPSVRDFTTNSFQDLDGNGFQDLVSTDEKGRPFAYYERLKDGYWTMQQLFPSILNINLNSIDVKRIDLTGDGHEDIMTVDNEMGEIIWHQSLGKKGFGPERRSHRGGVNKPRLLVNDDHCASYLADMGGDGMVDIMQIQNGRISYWPNLGHGAFGEEVVMGNSPVFESELGDDTVNFDRVQLLDIDGSGTPDLVYLLPTGGAVVFFNECGNSWSDGIFISRFPAINDLTSVFTLDLLGKGTSCLCWVGPDGASTSDLVIHYLDLASAGKPHLLHSFSNGIGLNTTVSHCPSTYFYLHDERDGKPWKTKLPFPVHVVKKLVERDVIAGTLKTTKYSYHDGYFDGYEREFRGFALVEKWEHEEFDFDVGQKRYRHPVSHSKLWYHTGSSETPLVPCPSTTFKSHSLRSMLPEDVMSLEFGRLDAFRALKGSAIRVETYALDGTEKEKIPYFIQESSHEVTVLQQGSGNTRPWVLRVAPAEAMTINVERQVNDHRVQHNLTLERNKFGDVTKALSISYGRKDSSLADMNCRDAQQADDIFYSETSYTNPINEIDSFYKPRVAVTRKFRLLGPNIEGLLNINMLQKDDFNYVRSMFERPSGDSDLLQYKEVIATVKSWFRVRIGETRVYFRSQDLTRRLKLGTIECFSVPDQTFRLSLTPDLRKHAYVGEETSLTASALPDLRQTARYVELDADDCWWEPSGKERFCHPNVESSVTELEQARKSFYTPIVYCDPFDNASTVEMDQFCLLPVKFIDAVGNVTLAHNDYRRLHAISVIDANENRIDLTFDSFGSITAIARMGKSTGAFGDNIDGVQQDVSHETLLAFIQNPTKKIATDLLGNSSIRSIQSRDIVDLQVGNTVNRIPTFSLELARTEHLARGVDESQNPQAGDITATINYNSGRRATIQTISLSAWEPGSSQWCVTSSATNDSKGNAIRTYMPFFSSNGLFQPAVSITSVAVITFFDAIGRTEGSLMPNHGWSKTSYSPWSRVDFDGGSTNLVSDPRLDLDIGSHFRALNTQLFLPTWQQTRSSTGNQSSEAAQKSRIYADNPTVTHLSPQGLEILHIRKYGAKQQTIAFEYDVCGNKIREKDSLSRIVQRNLYDMLGKRIAVDNMDAGKKTVVFDCLGQMILEKNCRGITKRHAYDELRRLTETRVQKDGEITSYVWAKRIYGEDERDASSRNMKGQLSQVYDQSGLVEYTEYDSHGNCIQSVSQLAVEYKSEIDCSKDFELESARYTTSLTFDALDRPKCSTDALGRKVWRQYNLTGGLKALYSSKNSGKDDQECHIANMEYTADGLPARADMSNGAHTVYSYDPETRQITQKKTVRRKDHTILEDYRYTYDCMGRISYVENLAQQTVFFRNKQVDASNEYWYDALGRLVKATGREMISPDGSGSMSMKQSVPTSPMAKAVLLGDGQSLARYTETYEYDDADNILRTQHESTAKEISGWTRNYTYGTGNRLVSSEVSGCQEHYGYDGDAGKVGCITSMPGYSKLDWDCSNQLHSSARQKIKNGIPETTWFVYDSSGKRIRKITERSIAAGEPITAGRKLKETIYLYAAEVYFTYEGDGTTANLSKHISQILRQADPDESPLVQIETEVASTNGSEVRKRVLTRYAVGIGLEVDDQAQVVSYEEYSPFGNTTLTACRGDIEAPSSYRFAAYRRDTETGLYLCGARYYAPWLGRWMSTDPLDTAGGLNMYCYSGNDPVNKADPKGTLDEPREADENKQRQTCWEKHRGTVALSGVAVSMLVVSYLGGLAVNSVSPQAPLASFGVSIGIAAVQNVATVVGHEFLKRKSSRYREFSEWRNSGKDNLIISGFGKVYDGVAKCWKSCRAKKVAPAGADDSVHIDILDADTGNNRTVVQENTMIQDNTINDIRVVDAEENAVVGPPGGDPNADRAKIRPHQEQKHMENLYRTFINLKEKNANGVANANPNANANDEQVDNYHNKSIGKNADGMRQRK